MRKGLLFILFLLAFNELYGQLQPLNKQYILDGLSINPAYAGRREAMSVAVSYRNQWVGFEGAPSTEIISVHSPLLNKKIGVGLLLMNNEIGVSNETGMMANYSYSIETGPGKLSFGLGAGVSIKNKNFNDLRALDEGDEVLNSAERVFVIPDFSMGVYFYSKQYFAGISMPFFMNYRFNSADGRFKAYHNFNNCNYMFTGGYLWKITEEIKILPNTLLKVNPSGGTQLDFNIHGIYRDKFWLGTSYKTNKGMNWILQCQISNQFRIAYSFGTEFSKLSSYEKGTHEIMLRYDFKYLVEVISPRFF